MDTCAAEGLIGVAEDGQWLQTKVLPDARRLGETLHIEVDALLEETGKSWAQLDAVAVVSGPGSYTGLRVGMATAKGWCFALDIPLITLNRLELLLHQCRKNRSFSGNTALLLPARAGEWFAIGADPTGALLFPPTHLTEELFNAAQERWHFRNILVAGEAGQQPAGCGEADTLLFKNAIVPTALDVILEGRFQQKQFADLMTAKPEYMKPVYINK